MEKQMFETTNQIVITWDRTIYTYNDSCREHLDVEVAFLENCRRYFQARVAWYTGTQFETWSASVCPLDRKFWPIPKYGTHFWSYQDHCGTFRPYLQETQGLTSQIYPNSCHLSFTPLLWSVCISVSEHYMSRLQHRPLHLRLPDNHKPANCREHIWL